MTLTAERDLDELRVGVERWLGRPVGTITRPAPGYSCETLVVDAELVVRLPPAGDGIFPTYDLATQAAVQQAAQRSGVPVAAPVRYEPDPSFLGTPFLTMGFADGPIPADFTPADPWLAALPDDRTRHAAWQSFVDTVARVHLVHVDDDLPLRRGLAAEVDHWTAYADWACEGSPPAELADALAWCVERRPAVAPPAGLLWGDVRLGNVVFDASTARPRAVLDWDMASVGPAELDLAWFLTLEALQTDLTGLAVPGFGDRTEAIAIVEGRIGRPVADLGWYEVFALARAGAVSTRIAILFERAGRPSMFRVGADPALAAAHRRIAAIG